MRLFMLMASLFGGMQLSATIPPSVVEATIEQLSSRDVAHQEMIARGVKQVANLWQQADGDEEAFRNFCLNS